MTVAIVGAGPAGAATALLLARNGVEVTLVERERRFDRVFRGEGLTPSGVDAVRQMGLGDVLDRLAGRPLEAWEVFADGHPIFTVPEPIHETGELAFRIIPQVQFLEALITEASRYPSFRFERGVAVRDLLRKDGRVAGLRLQEGDATRELDADLVLGCDGRGSLTRKRAALGLRLLPEHYDVAWFKLPAPERLRDRCVMMLGISGFHASACYTSWDGRLQYAWMLAKGDFRSTKERSSAEWAQEIARTAPPWLAEHILGATDELEGPVLLDVIVGRCHCWHAPGVLLLGDAAHPMSPIRAQGINLALRDAIVAANHLVPLFQGAATAREIDAAAAAIQTEREPEIVRSQTLQLRDARGMGTRFAPLLVKIAKHVGGFIGHFEWAQRAWLRQQHDLRFGSTEVRLEV